ncbi:MAG: energy transducer TonB [Salinibacter sp.]
MNGPASTGNSLRTQYYLHLEIGLLLSLAVLIVAFQADFSTEESFHVQMEEQETVTMKQIQQTQQESEPPPPPRPPTPMEVPNNQVIEQRDVNFDASIDLDATLDTRQKPSAPSDEGEEETEAVENEIFVAVEESPTLIGGMDSLRAAVEYPDIAEKAGVEGRVIVQFVVGKDGTVQDPTVIRGVHHLLDEAAIEAVKQQKFEPGRQRGEPVRVQMSLPVTFRLVDGTGQ